SRSSAARGACNGARLRVPRGRGDRSVQRDAGRRGDPLALSPSGERIGRGGYRKPSRLRPVPPPPPPPPCGGGGQDAPVRPVLRLPRHVALFLQPAALPGMVAVPPPPLPASRGAQPPPL